MLRSRYVWNITHPNDPVQGRDHIHHRDHDTLNDSPENLEKLTPTQHAQHHSRQPRKPLSDAHKAALSRSKKGRPLSEEHKAALRRAHAKRLGR